MFKGPFRGGLALVVNVEDDQAREAPAKSLMVAFSHVVSCSGTREEPTGLIVCESHDLAVRRKTTMSS